MLISLAAFYILYLAATFVGYTMKSRGEFSVWFDAYRKSGGAQRHRLALGIFQAMHAEGVSRGIYSNEQFKSMTKSVSNTENLVYFVDCMLEFALRRLIEELGEQSIMKQKAGVVCGMLIEEFSDTEEFEKLIIQR